MAAIDHTTITFKNGKWMQYEGKIDKETDEWVSLLPFECGRDGNIHLVQDPFGNPIDIWPEIKWYRDEYDALYERAGWRNFSMVRKAPRGIWAWLKYKLHFMHKICYRKEVGVWKKCDIKVYIYHDALNESYISFYKDCSDTYIVIGGYAHHKNVYCHFMDRGYGDEFEEKMAAEAFRWACDDILVEISESIYESWEEQEDFVNEMRDEFGYEELYKIVDRELGTRK